MSSYLLLRNNTESGPFTMEEIRGMSLKSYDLIWVIGKSAAWRYPGEITEFISFAPPVPDQFADLFRKKPNTENLTPDFAGEQQSSAGFKLGNDSRSVYVNLPAEKKQTVKTNTGGLPNSPWSTSGAENAEYDLSDIYQKQASKTVLYSGKILWVSTIALLFCAGILTGFFISDRRKYFTSDENRPQNQPAVQQVILANQKENSPANTGSITKNKISETNIMTADPLIQANPVSKKSKNGSGKKIAKHDGIIRDSVITQPAFLSTLKLNDSVKQNAGSKTEALYQKIKAHPENYLNLVTGRYSTSFFGGISSFPVTITNNSSLKLDAVIVTIEYVQNNAKVFKTKNLSFNDLEPGETVTIKAPKSSRGIKVATHLQVVNTRQPDPGSSN